MKIKIKETNSLDNRSQYILSRFIENLISKYNSFLMEEIIGPDDEIKRYSKYVDKAETKTSLLNTFTTIIENLTLDDIVNDISVNSSDQKGLSMYLTITFNIKNLVNDYVKFKEKYGDLSEFVVRVSDHPYNKYTGFDKNIIFNGKTINQILPSIQTYVTNRINRVKQSIQEFNEVENNG